MPTDAIQCKPLEVAVADRGIERAIKQLKRKMATEGIMKELKRRRQYMKPSVKRRKKAAEAARRRRKRARMEAGLISAAPPRTPGGGGGGGGGWGATSAPPSAKHRRRSAASDPRAEDAGSRFVVPDLVGSAPTRRATGAGLP